MKKRMKMVITSAMLAFSLALMSFGVFAASTHSLGINNYIMFDIGENIACDIEAVSAIGASPSVSFNTANAQDVKKTLNISADMASNSGQFTAVGGNTPLSQNGKWEPWTVGAPAGLTMANDTVYWMFKITNTSENAIQVRTELSRQDRYQRTILYGNSADAVPNDTESGFLEKDDTVYVLVALETLIKTKNVAGNISFNIVIEPAGVSYLFKNWSSIISEDIRNQIECVCLIGGSGDSFEEDEGAEYTQTFELGATDKNGNVELKGKEVENPYVNQVTGYLCDNGTVLYIHSPSRIYAPVNSTDLFSGLSCGELCASNLNTTNTTSMNSMFMDCTDLGYLEIWFDTIYVEDFAYMFSYCESLTFVEVDCLDTTRVVSMRKMFMCCYELPALDISNFYIREDCNVEDFITDCSSMEYIHTPYYVGTEVDLGDNNSQWLNEYVQRFPVDKSGEANIEYDMHG